MTATTGADVVHAMRRAAVRALRAPSVHNTQPWRFVIGQGCLEIHVDRERQLRVLDPLGRQMRISCGCALMNARVAFAAAGVNVDVLRQPDAHRPDLVARLVPNGAGHDAAALARLDPVVEERRTSRRRFGDEPVPEDVVRVMETSARAEGAELHWIRSDADRLATARLVRIADRIENADPAYRAEVRAWTSDDPRREDGVQAFSVPRVDGTAHDDLPLRDFDSRGTGWLPAHTGSASSSTLVVLGTVENTTLAWLRAGEALERILLELTLHAFSASPLNQVVEVPHTNALLRAELGLSMHPHLVLRIGRSPEASKTRRRRLADVLSDDTVNSSSPPEQSRASVIDHGEDTEISGRD